LVAAEELQVFRLLSASFGALVCGESVVQAELRSALPRRRPRPTAGLLDRLRMEAVRPGVAGELDSPHWRGIVEDLGMPGASSESLTEDDRCMTGPSAIIYLTSEPRDGVRRGEEGEKGSPSTSESDWERLPRDSGAACNSAHWMKADTTLGDKSWGAICIALTWHLDQVNRTGNSFAMCTSAFRSIIHTHKKKIMLSLNQCAMVR
jgi:hypothetical protein